ncbi:MAG: hypothetical protein E7813_05740 [Bradyrhizobium sp.]|nr:MAG: hypothetical protein E7813_05740 [Bradyrhizobium sp.]
MDTGSREENASKQESELRSDSIGTEMALGCERCGRPAMSDADKKNKARNREIAQNEATRQTVSDIRVSSWAIALAVIIGLISVGWVLTHNN